MKSNSPLMGKLREDPFLIPALLLSIVLLGCLLSVRFLDLPPELFGVERRIMGSIAGLTIVALTLSLAVSSSKIFLALSPDRRPAPIEPIDPLTKLPDRSLLDEKMELAIEHAKRFDHDAALLSIDLERFKRINDTYDHSIGDMALVEIGQRLLTSTRALDSVHRNMENSGKTAVSRIAGDEFIILLSQVDQPGDIVTIVERVLEALTQPILLGDLSLTIGVNIGISIYPSDASSPEEMMRHADRALIAAKRDTQASFRFYDESIGRAFDERRELEKDLRFAIGNEQLMIYYQPKVQPVSGEIVGAEALVRWNHPKLGTLSPDKFIDILKDTRLLQPMTEWIVENSCKLLIEMGGLDVKPIKIAVNLSGTDAVSEASIDSMVAIIERHGLTPNLFEFELTEDTFFGNEEAIIASLAKIRERGFQVAIDDFGTGFAALKYLILFPIDTIKIDKSFVQHIHLDLKSLFIVKSIMGLCKDLKIEVVAEGVERYEQLQLLTQLECDQIQGYFVSKPINSEELIRWVAEKRIFKYS